MKQTLTRIICENCGNIANVQNPNQTLCHICRNKIYARERSKRIRELESEEEREERLRRARDKNHNSYKRKTYYKPDECYEEHYKPYQPSEFEKIMREINTYNKNNGTNYSYGTYFTAVNQGKIKRKIK